MAGIFTRPEVLKIVSDDSIDQEERVTRIMMLRGRDLEDGYVSKATAKAERESAVEQAKTEWEKNLPKPDIRASEEYKNLESEYAGYRAMQEARGSEDYKGVKPKFFETVYGMINRAEGAPAVADQIATIRQNYEEYFNPQETGSGATPKNTPQYSKQPGMTGTNPESDEDRLVRELSGNW